MSDKPRIGEDPLWWIKPGSQRKARKPSGGGKKASAARKTPAPGWVRTVWEVRADHLEQLERIAEREDVTMKKLVDQIITGALEDKNLGSRKRTTRRPPR